MIGYLKGNVVSFDENSVIVETGGVGYEVVCSGSVYSKLVSDGKGEVFVYTAVKEDGITLYGFINPDEKKVFLSLIGVSGVGPKMAITVLSSMNADAVRRAIAAGDVKSLSAIKGLGKKTAERIILELKDKTDVSAAATGVPAAEIAPSGIQEDAIAALMGLGFTRGECLTAVKEGTASGLDTPEKLIAFALKHIR